MRRIAFLLCLVALVLAGCGGGGRQTSTLHRLPAPLAHAWARQAALISSAAAAGNSCEASRRADALQSDVMGSLDSVPVRYRATLRRAVTRLASGLTCTQTVTTVVTTAPVKPKPPPPPGHHGDHGPGHDHHHGGHGDHGGHGGDGG